MQWRSHPSSSRGRRWRVPKANVSSKSAPDATVQQQALGEEHELRVPAKINAKAIKADDELLMYRAPKRKVERPPASVKVAKLMKGKAK